MVDLKKLRIYGSFSTHYRHNTGKSFSHFSNFAFIYTPVQKDEYLNKPQNTFFKHRVMFNPPARAILERARLPHVTSQA